MRISDLIKQLKEIQLEYGDLEYGKLIHTYVDSHTEQGAYFETNITEPNIEVIDNPCGDGKLLMIEEE